MFLTTWKTPPAWKGDEAKRESVCAASEADGGRSGGKGGGRGLTCSHEEGYGWQDLLRSSHVRHRALERNRRRSNDTPKVSQPLRASSF